MKIKNILIFLLMIMIIMTVLNIKVYATIGKINSDTVRLRKEPTTESDILEQLDLGDEVEILEEADGWYKVVYTNDENKKITGYISATLLDIDKKENETNINEEQENNNESTDNQNTDEVTNQQEQVEEVPSTENTGNNIEENAEYTISKEIKVKILPLMNSKEIGVITDGTVKVVEIINDWCRIENDSEIGWIRKNALRKATTINENASTETTNTESNTSTENNSQNVENLTVIKTAYVSAESLKVRKEPNTTSEVIDSLIKNSQVSITEEIEGWYQIKIGDQIGYVSSSYISDTRVQETTSRSSTSKRGETVQTSTTAETTTETTSTATNATGEAVVAYAKQYLGYKYVAGGASPSKGFDCSGFTQYIYKHFGINLNRVSRDQSKNGVSVEKANLQQGDILLFRGSSGSAIGHVGIYIGGGKFIHAENPSTDVCITSLSSSYYSTRYVGARRVI